MTFDQVSICIVDIASYCVYLKSLRIIHFRMDDRIGVISFQTVIIERK